MLPLSGNINRIQVGAQVRAVDAGWSIAQS